MISIHAPTRGATYNKYKLVPKKGFQSTLPREERQSSFVISIFAGTNFNPRSHERSDTSVISVADFVDDFNPRSHERSDHSQ